MVDQQKSPIGRRAVAKGIAWSVPAVALATAAPAFALSLPVVIDLQGNACKWPGGSTGNDELWKAYQFPLSLSNQSSEQVTIKVESTHIVSSKNDFSGTGYLFINAVTGERLSEAELGEAGSLTDSIRLIFLVKGSSNSSQEANTVLTVKFSIEGSSGRKEERTVEITYPVTPPCEDDATPPPDPAAARMAKVEPEQEIDNAVVESEGTEAEPAESAAVKEQPAASDAGGAEPAASDGGR